MLVFHTYHTESNEGLDYSVSTHKALFEKCFGLRFKLTEGTLNDYYFNHNHFEQYSTSTDKAISFEFCHLTPALPDECCSITMDVNSEGQWEG